MLKLAFAAGAGAAVARLLWAGLGRVFDDRLFLRTNVAGREVPTAGGVLLPLALVAVLAVEALARPGAHRGIPFVGPTLVVGLGYGILGLLDDLAGGRPGDPKGFGGHLRALARGRLTTGGLKLFGGVVVALAAAGQIAAGAGREPGAVLVAAAVIALSANLANLFDRAPGRCIKVTLLAFAALLVVVASGAGALDGRAKALQAPFVVVGALVAILPVDLGERLMLGDTGANVAGGLAGLTLVLAVGRPGQLLAAAGLLVLNVVSERVSFSRVIEAVRPLRWFDHLGRRP